MDEPTDAELQAELRAQRRELALPTDDVIAGRLLAEYRAARFDGLWLLPEEREPFERMERELSDLAARVEAYGRAEAPGTYAGVWIDRPGVAAAFTRDLDAHRARLADDRIRFRPADYTERELEELVERIRADRELDFRMLGTDVIANRVIASVIAPDPERAAALARERYGDAVRVDVIAGESHRIEATPWQRFEVADDDRTLTVHWFTNSAYRLHEITADEGPHEVRVTIREEVPNGPVTLAGAQRRAEITLTAALAGREIVDGAR